MHGRDYGQAAEMLDKGSSDHVVGCGFGFGDACHVAFGVIVVVAGCFRAVCGLVKGCSVAQWGAAEIDGLVCVFGVVARSFCNRGWLGCSGLLLLPAAEWLERCGGFQGPMTGSQTC